MSSPNLMVLAPNLARKYDRELHARLSEELGGDVDLIWLDGSQEGWVDLWSALSVQREVLIWEAHGGDYLTESGTRVNGTEVGDLYYTPERVLEEISKGKTPKALLVVACYQKVDAWDRAMRSTSRAKPRSVAIYDGVVPGRSARRLAGAASAYLPSHLETTEAWLDSVDALHEPRGSVPGRPVELTAIRETTARLKPPHSPHSDTPEERGTWHVVT